MKNFKKVILMCLAMVLVAALAIAGTIAYLTDTDSKTNVMVVGNVYIEQHELERVDINENSQTDAVEFKEFTQAKPLYPAVLEMEGYAANDPQAWAPAGANGALEDHYVNYGDFVTADVAAGASAWNGVWGTSLKNVIDKFVFVENTGKSDAYYRTIILLEYDETETKNSYGQPMVHFNYNGNALFAWEGVGDKELTTVEVNGEVYQLLVATYKNPLKPGTVSRPSLLQVGLDGEATNEIVEQFGDTYDILVLSQAVQTEGFADAQTALNTAFGETNAVNVAAWFSGTKVPEIVDNDNIKDALDEGKDVIFGDDIEMPAEDSNGYGKTAIKVYKGQTLDGADNSFKAHYATDTWDSAITAYGGTIKNLTVGKGFRGIFISHITGDQGEKCGLVTFENVVIDGPVYTFNCDQGTNNGLKAINCTFNGWTSYAATIGTVKFDGCSFGEGAGYAFCRPYAPTEFVNCDFEAGFEIDAVAAVTFENCRLDGVLITADNIGNLVTGNTANATVK